MIKNIIVMRRDKPTLEERLALQEKFPKDEFHFIRTDPKDYIEHDELCKKHNADVVLLPREKPIPVQAMERGVAHVTLVPGKGLSMLVELHPILVPFLVHN